MAKRGKGRRRSRKRTDAPVMNPEHARWIADTAREAAEFNEERRRKVARSEGELRMEEENQNSVEVFVGNVPHNTRAKDLAMALENIVRSSMPYSYRRTPKDHILRCCVRRKGPRTFAFVMLRSEAGARALQSSSPEFGGRKLHFKPSKAVAHKELVMTDWFSCKGFQLCAEWPPGKLTCVWEVTSSKVAFQVWKSESLARLSFGLPSGSVGQAEFKRRHIDGEVKIMQDSLSRWLVFKLLRPPFLSLKPGGTPNSFAELMFFAAVALEAGDRGSLWALGLDEENPWMFDDKKGFHRSGDLSPQKTAFGSCLTYRIDISTLSKEMMSKLFDELHSFRLTSSPGTLAPFLSPSRMPYTVNPYDSRRSKHGWEATNIGLNLHAHLPYSVVYLIECLTSNLKMEPLSITEDFLQVLAQVNERQACLALQKMFEMDPRRRMRGGLSPDMELIRLLDRYSNIFDIDYRNEEQESAMSSRRSHQMVRMRRAFLTPLRVVCLPPEIEASNGVTRHFFAYSDRFMRVTFADENLGRVPAPLSDGLAERMRESMNKGLLIAGRRYKFLAYSSSQLRSHSCWFYAGPGSDEDLRRGRAIREEVGMPTAASIRGWIGDLNHIKIVGKHAARLGQSLSSTTATVKVPPHREKLIADKKSGPYEFTDGCGLMSMALAKRVAEQLSLPPEQPPPSAFQVRIGGCKGVLTAWPEDVMTMVCGSSGYDIAVRPSLRKFESRRNDLEVIQYARVVPCYLNRQLITILTTLGVRDAPIENLHALMSEALHEIVYDKGAAETALIRFNNNPPGSRNAHGASPLGSLAEALIMVRSGFDIIETAYLQSVLRATRDKALVELRNRARIFVPKGVCLIGVVDETGILNPGEVYFSLAPNPGLYSTARDVKTPDFGALVLVGRNPSLHPGDLRVLTRADVPALHHLQNVVVFPCRGDRPEPSKMSGGDLDGDMYTVIWDDELLPPTVSVGGHRNFPPMNYEPPTGKPVQAVVGPVKVEDITEFVVNYIKNDNLGMIANSHLVWADKSVEGARCGECLELAALHSTAVDFCKSGVPAEFHKGLRPLEYPDFMQKKGKVSYRSDKLLGRLFRKKPELEDVAGYAAYGGGTGFGTSSRAGQKVTLDQSLLVPGWEGFREEAEVVFGEYCRDLLSLARKYGVYDEGELLSCQVVRFKAKAMRRYKLEDAQGRLSVELSQFKAYYREEFQRLLQDEDSEGSVGDNENSEDDEEEADGKEGEEDDEEEEEDDDEEEEKGHEEDEDVSKIKRMEEYLGLSARTPQALGRGPQAAPSHGGAGVPPAGLIAVDVPPSQMGRHPKGVEVLQQASAWYFVSHHSDTNPYLRPDTVGWGSPIAFLSFPWVCAYEHLCAIKHMRAKTGPG